MQRWALLLSAYIYDIEFRPTDLHANADGLSRLPLSDSPPPGNSSDATVFNMVQLETLPVTVNNISSAICSDPVLSKLLVCLRQGWPEPVQDILIPFWRRKEGLSIEGDCILWGCRVLIHSKLQKRELEELHVANPGVIRMKALAFSHVWWSEFDKAIEESAKACATCQSTKNSPPKAPLHPWGWSTAPWERVHVDFAGPFLGKMFLVAIDSHSKWPEVIIMTSTTTSKTTAVLRELFCRNGIPRHIVSDNGLQFILEEFSHFMVANGVKHTRTSPYHPAINGAAERMVQTMKKALRVGHQEGLPLEQSLASFLLRYRTTPQATTGVSPCSLFVGRDLRARLHLLSPDVGAHVRDQQTLQKGYHDRHSCARELNIGQQVWARNFRDGPSWVRAVESDRVGTVSYLVQLRDGDLWRRHVDHLRVGHDPPPTVSEWSSHSGSC